MNLVTDGPRHPVSQSSKARVFRNIMHAANTLAAQGQKGTVKLRVFELLTEKEILELREDLPPGISLEGQLVTIIFSREEE